jgi:hypothetical protein
VRILFDQGTPDPLRRALGAHSISTAYEMGWMELGNGELLRAAQNNFDALVTTDKNLQYQQDLTRFQLAVLVLPTTSWPKLRPHAAQIAAAVDALVPGELIFFRLPDSI